MCYVLEENIWLYHNKIYLRYASGQSLRGKLPNMVSQKKYSAWTEMIYPSKNGMAVTNGQTKGKPSSSCMQVLTKIYPFKYSMFCCRLELPTSNFQVMKLDEVASNNQNLS